MTRLTDFAETGWKVTLTFLLSRGLNSPPDGSNVNSLKACKINRILSGLKLRVRNRKLTFLFFNQNICCGYSKEPSQWDSSFEHPKHILTHTSNAKCFGNVTLINIRGLAEIIVPVRVYGRHSPNQVMIKREWLTDEVLLISVLFFDKIALQWMKQYM